jgi:hypothetical protein
MPRTMDPKVLDALRYAFRTGCTAKEAIEKCGAKCQARNLQAHISRHRNMLRATPTEAVVAVEESLADLLSKKRPRLSDSPVRGKKSDMKPSPARKHGQQKSLFRLTAKQKNTVNKQDFDKKKAYSESFKEAGTMCVIVLNLLITPCALSTASPPPPVCLSSKV